MARNTRKRKNPCQDTLFVEVNEDELSSEDDKHEDIEPNIKAMKTDGEVLQEGTLENNLKTVEIELFVKESITETTTETEISCTETENLIASCDNKPEFPSDVSKVEIVSKDLEDGELNDTNLSYGTLDTPDSKISTDNEIHISFGNKKLADLYKHKFLKFLDKFIELEIIKETDLSVTVQRDSILNSEEWVVLDETEYSPVSTELIHNAQTPIKSKKKKVKKKKHDEDFFVVDINPSKNESVDHFTKYSSKFQINTEEAKAEDDTPNRKVSAQTCFNCDDSHSLKDCPHPKDYSKINAARNKFKTQKLTTRYHLEADQKYGHYTPGNISPALRQALGLRRNEIPPYIYRMRRLGYPSGWLEEAKYFYSNLDLFDADGNPVRQSASRKKQGLNPEKIIDYPGFNSPMDKYVKDDYKKFCVPPYSDRFSKETMIAAFEKQFANQQDDFDTCEMDVDAPENGGADKKESDEEKLEINEGNQDSSLVKVAKETADICLPSPSLVELEKEKENLLLALEDNCSLNAVLEETSDERETPVTSEEINHTDSQDEDTLISMEESINLNNSVDEGISDTENVSSNNSTIKTSAFGTPILKSQSPYSRLPNMDNFTKDVSPVINFENLPNSTGKYEQMTEVLQKVRTKMKISKTVNRDVL